MITLAHPSPHPNGISIGSAVFCRAHDRDRPTDRQRYSVCNNNSWQNVVGYAEHVLSPKNCPFAWGDLDPHPMHGSLGANSSPQPKRHLDLFILYAQLTAECPYTLQCGLIITNGQSILKKSRIAATHSRFSRIRQVAPICIPSAFAPYRFRVYVASRFENISRSHVRASAIGHLGFLIKFFVL